MKKIYTLSFLTLFFLFSANTSKAQTQLDLTLDYWGMDYGYAGTQFGDTFQNFSWNANKNYPNDTFFSFRNFCVLYDTLMNYDYNNNALLGSYPLNANTTVRCDSFDLYYSHARNVTSSTDTLYMKLFDISTLTITGTGPAAQFNFTTLWQDSIKVSGSNTINAQGTSIGGGLYYLTRRPNITLPVGHSYGIFVEFRGNKSNYFQVLAGGTDHCSSQCGVEQAYAPDNSLYYVNAIQGGTNYSGINPIYYDCDNNSVNTPGACEYFYPENIAVPSYAHVTIANGGSVCTPDAGVTSGMGPASSSVPCINQGQAFTQTFTFVVPSSVTVPGFGSVPVSSITFDNIINLPSGLNYAFSQTPATYVGGTSGCFTVSGTTNAACGQYAMPIYVTVNITGVGSFGSYRLDSLATATGLSGFDMRYLRVKATSGTCPAVNSSPSSWFVADPTCGIATGITLTTSKTDVNCFGQSTGSATVTATGGTVYTYAWSNSGTNATISNVPAGTYTVTVTSGGQSATASVTITQPSSAVSATTGSTQASCSQNNGSASVTASGGTPGYTYSWSNSGTGASISNAGAGTYTVTVTDSKGCTVSASVTVTTPASFTVTVSTTNVLCYGANTGSATANVTGGSNLSYVWNNSGNTAIISNLQAGTYNVTVTDGNGCNQTASGTVTQPANPLTATAASTPSSCGSSTGTATVTVTNNVGSPSYVWNPGGGTTSTITNLAAGNYSVTVTAGGCTATASTAVNNSNGPNVTVQKVDPTCFGSNNGSATASVSGGTPGYTYLWSNNATGTSINGLNAGTYTLVVTDNGGCSAFGSITLTQPNPITLTETITNVNCNGNQTGAISLAVGGGTGPYAYAWSNSGSNATVNNLAAGSYTVTVTDSRTCTTSSNYTVTQPTVLTVTATSTPSSGSNGTATASVSGGTSPYNYSWSTAPAQTTAVATSLPSGSYSVTVTDSKACSATASVTVGTTGIDEAGNVVTSFSLFPNPATDQLNVVMELEGTHSLQLNITDVNGNVIYSSKETVNGKWSHVIDVNEFSAGVYIVEAIAGKQTVRKRFTVIR